MKLLPQLGLTETAPALPFPYLAAWAGSFAEIILPAALVIGFATRLSALGLLVMTAVIFMVNPASWPNEQLPWAAMAIALIAFGPGFVSFDAMIRNALRRR